MIFEIGIVVIAVGISMIQWREINHREKMQIHMFKRDNHYEQVHWLYTCGFYETINIVNEEIYFFGG